MKTSDLQVGLTVENDVNGKTGRPLVFKDTILTEQHIEILNKFLVSEVDIITNEKTTRKQNDEHIKVDSSFVKHYLEVVDQFKKEFKQWRNTMIIDMLSLRKIILPLLQRIDEPNTDVFSLFQYATKEDYLFHHSIAIGLLSTLLAKEMDNSKKDCLQVGLAGVLSDAGMARISSSILQKETTLNEREKKEIKDHPLYSYKIIEHSHSVSKAVKLTVSQHHERLDGSGYPLGITQEEIHHYSRIVAVSDVFHAMACDKVYQERKVIFDVIECIHKDRFTKYDPIVVQALINQFIKFLTGKKLKLSTGEVGRVVFTDHKTYTRPIIQLDCSGEIINLEKNRSIQIKVVL